jgi:hypothetical protein
VLTSKNHGGNWLNDSFEAYELLLVRERDQTKHTQGEMQGHARELWDLDCFSLRACPLVEFTETGLDFK